MTDPLMMPCPDHLPATSMSLEQRLAVQCGRCEDGKVRVVSVLAAKTVACPGMPIEVARQRHVEGKECIPCGGTSSVPRYEGLWRACEGVPYMNHGFDFDTISWQHDTCCGGTLRVLVGDAEAAMVVADTLTEWSWQTSPSAKKPYHFAVRQGSRWINGSGDTAREAILRAAVEMASVDAVESSTWHLREGCTDRGLQQQETVMSIRTTKPGKDR